MVLVVALASVVEVVVVVKVVIVVIVLLIPLARSAVLSDNINVYTNLETCILSRLFCQPLIGNGDTKAVLYEKGTGYFFFNVKFAIDKIQYKEQEHSLARTVHRALGSERTQCCRRIVGIKMDRTLINLSNCMTKKLYDS